MINVHDLAAYVLRREGRMTAFKLQKLLYYSQAWSLAWDGTALFSDPIKAWDNGPVVPEIYKHHKGWLYVGASWPIGDAGHAEGARSTIDPVLDFYGKRSVDALIELTHREPPWLEAREGVPAGSSKEISQASMRKYYGHLATCRDGRVPVDEWQDRLRADFEKQLAALAGNLPNEVHADASVLAEQIVEHVSPTPSSVTILPSGRRALFSLFGKNEREADVWVDGKGGAMSVVKSDGARDTEQEERLPIAKFSSVASWLAGE